jgi:transcriptional regulator with XRE-family HTH domain
MTQETLGLEAGLQRKYISSLELGEKQPSIATIFKLAAALGMSARELVGLVELEVSLSS